MSMRVRVLVLALLVVGVTAGSLVLTGGIGDLGTLIGRPGGPPGANPTAGPGSSVGPGAGPTVDPTPTPAPTPTPRPDAGGTELFGYLPYWQMTGSMATYLRSTPLTTLALFSVAARRNGGLQTNTTAYRRITGDIGRRLIDEAHARGTRVELVFTSFGAERNGRLFGRIVPTPSPTPGATPSLLPGQTPGAPGASATPAVPTALPTPSPSPTPPWHRTIRELVALAAELGVDGINVDVELLDEADRPAFGDFLAALRAALVTVVPDGSLTVATEAGPRGVANAAVATAAGVDRLFLMGYDYHWSGSAPGASSPVDRDDGVYTLRWSIDRYVEAGVPRDRILLGLPLYGMRWRMTGPHRVYDVIGRGVAWIPSRNLSLLLDRSFQARRNYLEQAEYFLRSDGDEWLLTFYDSPITLRPKLALAVDNGLAGAGFWAMGYERGLPGYLELMQAFRDGQVAREEAPPRP